MSLMTDKDTYRELCETEGDNIPLFLQYWWMEAVCCGKRWDVALARDKQGAVSGVFPYLIGSRCGLRYIIQPQLTQYTGPWYRFPEGLDACHRFDFETQTAHQLADHILARKAVYLNLNFGPHITNWLPYCWKGFRQTTRYTFRIPDLQDLDAVWGGFDRHHRQNKILKAQQELTLDEGLSPQEFAAFHARYWDRKGGRDLLSQDFIVRVVSAALGRGQGIVLALRDREGALQGARFAAYDSHCAYALLSALDPDRHVNGCSPLLFWELFRRLSGKTRSFDFEGSMSPSIGRSYRLYGAEQVPYMEIKKFGWGS